MWKEVNIDGDRVLGLECDGKLSKQDFETMHTWRAPLHRAIPFRLAPRGSALTRPGLGNLRGDRPLSCHERS